MPIAPENITHVDNEVPIYNVNFTIKKPLVPEKINKITIINMPKHEYNVGDPLDLSGLQLEVMDDHYAKKTVRYDELKKFGLTASPANNENLTKENTKVTISHTNGTKCDIPLTIYDMQDKAAAPDHVKVYNKKTNELLKKIQLPKNIEFLELPLEFKGKEDEYLRFELCNKDGVLLQPDDVQITKVMATVKFTPEQQKWLDGQLQLAMGYRYPKAVAAEEPQKAVQAEAATTTPVPKSNAGGAGAEVVTPAPAVPKVEDTNKGTTDGEMAEQETPAPDVVDTSQAVVPDTTTPEVEAKPEAAPEATLNTDTAESEPQSEATAPESDGQALEEK